MIKVLRPHQREGRAACRPSPHITACECPLSNSYVRQMLASSYADRDAAVSHDTLDLLNLPGGSGMSKVRARSLAREASPGWRAHHFTLQTSL